MYPIFQAYLMSNSIQLPKHYGAVHCSESKHLVRVGLFKCHKLQEQESQEQIPNNVMLKTNNLENIITQDLPP